MKRGTGGNEHDLIRLLNAELPPDEARALRERMRSEPELAEAWRRLERTWGGLEPPPAAPVPPGFTGRVMADIRSQSGSLSWSSAPGWVRATAAAALVAGAALGIGVGRSLPVPEAHPAAVSEIASDSIASIPSGEEDESLVGSYWSLVGDTTDSDMEEALP
jgi:anti-sigma factor RsiW